MQSSGYQISFLAVIKRGLVAKSAGLKTRHLAILRIPLGHGCNLWIVLCVGVCVCVCVCVTVGVGGLKLQPVNHALCVTTGVA